MNNPVPPPTQPPLEPVQEPLDVIDLGETLIMLDDLRARLVALDGTELNIEVRTKAVNAEKAEINRKLLYLAHLADLVRADVMNHYHRFKGETPPWISAEDD